MKKLFFVLAALCLAVSGYGQKVDIEPYYIGERVSDIPLSHIINYKSDTATFSSFGHKLIILDFWHTHCSSCIAMFPLEDSLQRVFSKQVQFILITAESDRVVKPFLKKWDSLHHTQLKIPIVTADILLNKMFRHRYNPHYVWLAPDGRILAQTSDGFVNATVIKQMLQHIQKTEAHLKAGYFSEKMFHFPAMTGLQSQTIQQFQN